MRRMIVFSGLCAIGIAIALVGCANGNRLAVCESTTFDELMPRPAHYILNGDRTVAAERLRDVTVVKGTVPGAPAATADEAYILEIGSDGAKITAPGPFGEIWARVTLDQLVRLSWDGRLYRAALSRLKYEESGIAMKRKILATAVCIFSARRLICSV